MFVNTQQVQIGVTNFVEQEIAKQATGKWRYIYQLAVPRVGRVVCDYINTYRDNILVKDLFDENGNIDLDKLYDECVDAIRKTGKFECFGIWVSEDTLKTIYGYISR